MKHPHPRSCLVLLLGGATTLAALAQNPAPAPVANATSVEGTAYVTRADGRQTILARGTALGVGDALSTTRNSTVRLRFTDGGETAVRPDSRITVQAYNYSRDEPQSDSLILGLLKGGLRAITGSIGKRGNLDAYKLNVNTATIGIRGTDYTARLCNNDCKPESEPIARTPRPNSGPPVIARVLQAQGGVTVERDSRQVDVAQGAALYASDRVSTTPGGHAVLGFRDDTRITLNSGTQLALAQYTYDAAQPARGNMLFQLLSGGLRVATGLIAKSAPRQVKFQTSTATIGIRGTVFDLACGKAGAAEDAQPGDLTDVECNQSLIATTRVGEITLASSDGREVSIPAGQSGLAGAQGAARALASTPAYFNTIGTPAPEAVEVNLEQLFGSVTPAPEARTSPSVGPRRSVMTNRTGAVASGSPALGTPAPGSELGPPGPPCDVAGLGTSPPSSHSGPRNAAETMKKTRMTMTTSTIGVMLGPKCMLERSRAARRRSGPVLMAHLWARRWAKPWARQRDHQLGRRLGQHLGRRLGRRLGQHLGRLRRAGSRSRPG